MTDSKDDININNNNNDINNDMSENEENNKDKDNYRDEVECSPLYLCLPSLCDDSKPVYLPLHLLPLLLSSFPDKNTANLNLNNPDKRREPDRPTTTADPDGRHQQ
jgi:hypothetical protein